MRFDSNITLHGEIGLPVAHGRAANSSESHRSPQNPVEPALGPNHPPQPSVKEATRKQAAEDDIVIEK
jgi:hypothetical protein